MPANSTKKLQNSAIAKNMLHYCNIFQSFMTVS